MLTPEFQFSEPLQKRESKSTLSLRIQQASTLAEIHTLLQNWWQTNPAVAEETISPLFPQQSIADIAKVVEECLFNPTPEKIGEFFTASTREAVILHIRQIIDNHTLETEAQRLSN